MCNKRCFDIKKFALLLGFILFNSLACGNLPEKRLFWAKIDEEKWILIDKRGNVRSDTFNYVSAQSSQSYWEIASGNKIRCKSYLVPFSYGAFDEIGQDNINNNWAYAVTKKQCKHNSLVFGGRRNCVNQKRKSWTCGLGKLHY